MVSLTCYLRLSVSVPVRVLLSGVHDGERNGKGRMKDVVEPETANDRMEMKVMNGILVCWDKFVIYY